ncbi:M23 family metallopeptidase [Aquimarina sp. RZ0]|nr:M23 family metallopeptidase [Aquimarina sp. RZ0]
MEEDYNKIPSAPLGGEVFVIAKTTNLDEKEVTITIQEKEELLVGVDAPLPVLEITEETENEEEQEGQAKGNESTELKANVEDGIAKIKIRLRPKSDEDLQKWQDILAGKKPKEEDEETEYESVEEIEKGDTGSRNQNSQDSPETQLTFGLENRNIINNDLLVNPSVPLSFPDTPGPTAPLTSIRPKARPEDLVSTPKTEFLWLKASANGDEQCHHGKFLNKDDKAYFRIGKNKDIIFPLLVKPLNDIEGPNKRHYWAADRKNQTNYDVRRSDTRQHAARDLETDPFENVVAIAVGEVLRVAYFYEGTWQITILHEIPDGRKFIVRYGELDPDVNNNYKTGDSVVQSQVLGKTGDLTSITRFMLHFELYSGEQGYDLTIPLAGGGKFQRRTDLIDPLTILKEGYRNTFEEGTAFNDWAHSPFGNRIALKESQNNYNLCNRRRGKNDYPMVRGFIIVDMTIAEVMALQSDTSILFATGRYQIVPETLIEGVRMLGLNVNEKYDEAMQDRLFNEYLIDVKPNRKPIINFLESDGSVEDAMYACAQEWAAIGVEVGRRLKEGISTNGQSYYAGIGGNRAHISPDEIKALLIESKANINN